jgi:signal transduction histidine kinase
MPRLDEQHRSLFDVAGSLLGELQPDLVIDRLLESARELTGARYAAVGVLDASKTQLEKFITAGIDAAARAQIGELPRGRGVLGELINTPAPLRLGEVGDHTRSYGFPQGHPPMHSFLGVPILAGGVSFGSLYLTEKAGGAQFTDIDEESITILARFAGVAIDHARRYTGAADRSEELAGQLAAFKAMTEIARALGGATDLDVILELVAKRGRDLVSARALLIALVDGSELNVAGAAGALPAGLIGARVALADTVASAALRTRTTQRLESELNRARFDQRDLGALGVRAEAGLVVPLVLHAESYGVLVVLDRLHAGPGFSAGDQRLLEGFATSAAIAVATARTTGAEVRRQRLAAAEDERGRWARELHDETLQALAALKLNLSSARRTGGLRVLDDAVGDAIESLRDGISNLRALVTDLRPAALDALGLEAAIRGLCDRASCRGLEVDSLIDLAYERGRQPARHTAELETAIYRITQEALTNATKHGHAKRAVIEIEESQTTVELSVRDDGRGFAPGASTAGFGMLGMRERVALLHGTVEIESSVGAGTRVTARLPARRRPAEAATAPPEPMRSTAIL